MTQERVVGGNGYIGHLAQAAGVPPKTIRYYEEIKLLPRPNRTDSGYRRYSTDMVERLRFIKKTQHLGLSLEKIRDILDLMDRGRCPCGHVEQLLRQELKDIAAKEEELRALKRRIQQVLQGAATSTGRFPNGQAKCSTMDRVVHPLAVEKTKSGPMFPHRKGFLKDSRR